MSVIQTMWLLVGLLFLSISVWIAWIDQCLDDVPWPVAPAYFGGASFCFLVGTGRSIGGQAEVAVIALALGGLAAVGVVTAIWTWHHYQLRSPLSRAVELMGAVTEDAHRTRMDVRARRREQRRPDPEVDDGKR